MGIHYQESNIHWNYFLSIERDFEKLSRYIEFTESNNNTFSIELARLLMTATQEVDVIMKDLCKLVDERSNADSIGGYKTIINDKIPEFNDERVFIPRFGMNSKPWSEWKYENKHPIWWTANNKIKHHRTEYFERANFKNTFNAIGGLLLTTLYYYKKKVENEKGAEMDWMELTGMLLPKTNLYKLKDDYYYGEFVIEKKEW
jgi:hypothetical protein